MDAPINGTAATPLLLDLMEPEQPNATRAVLPFLKSEALQPADFTIREDGVVRLNSELAKRQDGLDCDENNKLKLDRRGKKLCFGASIIIANIRVEVASN